MTYNYLFIYLFIYLFGEDDNFFEHKAVATSTEQSLS